MASFSLGFLYKHHSLTLHPPFPSTSSLPPSFLSENHPQDQGTDSALASAYTSILAPQTLPWPGAETNCPQVCTISQGYWLHQLHQSGSENVLFFLVCFSCCKMWILFPICLLVIVTTKGDILLIYSLTQ